MQVTILDSFVNIIDSGLSGISDWINNRSSKNYVTRRGSEFEEFIIDSFTGFEYKTTSSKQKEDKSVFLHTGSGKNPPDLVLRSGTAIEIKKISGTSKGLLHLNSSWPRQHINSEDPKVGKNFLDAVTAGVDYDVCYVIGQIYSGRVLGGVWYVYGDSMFPDNLSFENVLAAIKIELPSGYTKTRKTNEIAVIEVGDTLLRVRGMWMAPHPQKVFSSIDFFKYPEKGMALFVVCRSSKYEDLKEEAQCSPRLQQLIDERRVEKHVFMFKDPDAIGSMIELTALKWCRT